MADLFLVAPHDADAERFPELLARVLASRDAAALLLPRGDRDAATYDALVNAAAPVAQAKDVAVLIEGTPADVRRLGADGLHVIDADDVTPALEALKPDFIVGAGGFTEKHTAMEAGEAGVDYVFFGPLSGPIDPDAREMARWWAETMTVPSVFSNPDASDPNDTEGCEFVALGGPLWLEPAA